MIESPSAPQSSRVCDTALGTEREASLSPLLAEEPGPDLPKPGESCGIARPCLASLVHYSLVWG